MVTKDIEALSLLNRSAVPSRVLQNLIIRRSDALVNDALRKTANWIDSNPVIRSVSAIDEVSGTVQSFRLTTSGVLGPGVKFKAHKLRAEGKATAEVVKDQNTLNSKEIKWACKGDHGIGDFAVRFTVIPNAFDKSLLFAGLLPLSKADIKVKLDNINKQLTDPMIPTLRPKIHKSTTKKVHVIPQPISLLPTEAQDCRTVEL